MIFISLFKSGIMVIVNDQEEDRLQQNQLFVLKNKEIKAFQVEILWAK